MGTKSTGQQPNLPSQEEVNDNSEGLSEEQIAPAAQPLDYNELVKAIMKNMPAAQTIDVDALTRAINKDNKDNKIQSHGLTQGQMKDIREAQMKGEVEMIPSNKFSKYLIPKHEDKLMHFTTEKIAYDTNTGEKISKPRYHVKTAQDFTRMSKSVKEKGDKINPENAFAGMKVTILHEVRPDVIAGIQKNAIPEKRFNPADELDKMDEEMIRSIYFDAYQEDALPSDSKKIMIELIKEKWAQ